MSDIPLKPGEAPQLIDAPYFNTSTVEVAATNTDFVFSFSRIHPAHLIQPDGARVSAGVNQPTAILVMSPQAAKELLVVLSDVMAKHEKDNGEIITDFVKARRQSHK